MNNNQKCLIVRAGLLEYPKALKLQEKIFQLKREGKIKEDVAIFLEHPPTITIGKKGSLNEILLDEEKLKQKGIFLCKTGRGGKVTYHGPGQIVAYPILNLLNYGKDLHLYLRCLEEVIIKTLRDFDVFAERKKGLTGAWVEDKKIASIGVQIKNWTSMHGLAFNINCDLAYFNLIQPCGMEPEVMTSLGCILKKNIEMQNVEERLIYHFSKVFSVRIQILSLDELKKAKFGSQLVIHKP
ncbi:lipoyl(octanoyl) transferase LipB [Candidatus Aerophobetes bacterium]|nr:lipoyl(octanoyl) transferase LipB [Candidatus Aerophobetes bacterium]